MNIDLLVAISTFSISFIISLFVYLNNRRSATNIYFSLLMLFIGLYALFNFASLNSNSSEQALFWAKLILLSAIPQGPLFYSFVRTFPRTNFLFNKKIQIFLFFWVFINLILAVSGLIFKSVEIVNNQPVIHPGPAVPFFGLLQGLSVLAGSWELIKKYRHSRGLLKLQLRYITYGILISFGLMLLSTIIMPLAFHITIFIPLSSTYLAIAGVSIAYSILRHRLMDIRLVVARAVSYALLVGLFAVFYAISFAALSYVFIGTTLGTRALVISTILALFMAFTFQSLRRVLEKITDKFLYKDHYDADTLLYNLTYIMASTLKLEDLTHQLLQEILKQMRITRGAFILTEGDKIYEVAHEGYSDPPELDEQRMLVLIKQNKMIIFEELQESPVKNILRELDFSLTACLNAEGEKIGLLVFGPKLSGDIYTEEDIGVINIFASSVAVAIQNAKSYEEIRRFSITLEEEVNQATADLKTANDKLQQLDKLKDDFVSLASHELRTPMTVIKSYLWLLIEGKDGQLNEKQKVYLDRAYSSTDRLIALVNDLLNVSRIESGRLTLDIQPVDIQKLAADVITEMTPRSQEMKLTLLLQKPANNIPNVLIDAGKIKEVFINLIGNSLKFTPAGGKITVSLGDKNGQVLVSVADTGRGIKQEDLPNLFQKFGSTGNSYLNKADTQGTGLGLYLSKSLVELQGGKIWAESNGENKGSTFSFSLKTAGNQTVKS